MGASSWTWPPGCLWRCSPGRLLPGTTRTYLGPSSPCHSRSLRSDLWLSALDPRFPRLPLPPQAVRHLLLLHCRYFRCWLAVSSGKLACCQVLLPSSSGRLGFRLARRTSRDASQKHTAHFAGAQLDIAALWTAGGRETRELSVQWN